MAGLIERSRNESNRLNRLNTNQKTKGCCPEDEGNGGGGEGIYGGSGFVPADTEAVFTDNFWLGDVAPDAPAIPNALIINYPLFGGIVPDGTALVRKNPSYDQPMFYGMFDDPSGLGIPAGFELNLWSGIPGNAVDQSSTRASHHVDPTTGDVLMVYFAEMWANQNSNATTVVGAEHYRGTGTSNAQLKASADGNSTAEAQAVVFASNDSTGASGNHIARLLAVDNTGTIAGFLQADMLYQEFGGNEIGITLNNISGLSVGDITAGTEYYLPLTRGTNNQILKIDGSGVVTWQNEAGAVNTLYSANDTIGAGRVANLTDTFEISNANGALYLNSTAFGVATNVYGWTKGTSVPGTMNLFSAGGDFSGAGGDPNEIRHGVGELGSTGGNSVLFNRVDASGKPFTTLGSTAFNNQFAQTIVASQNIGTGTSNASTIIFSESVSDVATPAETLIYAKADSASFDPYVGVYITNDDPGKNYAKGIGLIEPYVIIGDQLLGGSEYYLPYTRGSDGQVLVTSGGIVTWENPITPELDAVQEDVNGVNTALSITTYLTTLSDSPPSAPHSHTLADGSFVGQLKEIRTIDISGIHTVTPTNFADGTSIDMTANGMVVVLRWNGTNWRIIKNVKTITPLNSPATINP